MFGKLGDFFIYNYMYFSYLPSYSKTLISSTAANAGALVIGDILENSIRI